MYLFEDSGSPDVADFRDINGGDDSGVVWHEYTHGLSNRLVVNADGAGALSTQHAGAMGEAWSDWYASDFQVADGIKDDTLGTPGEIDVGAYSDLDPHALRTQALDCPVNAVTASCPGGAATGIGGYTLGDFGNVIGTPEVHADGEIWSETLWDLRQALEVKTGSAATASAFAEVARDRRHAGLAARAVDARHAQRDPDRRADRLRRRGARPRVGRLPQARHGLLRRRGRRRGHAPGRGLHAAAGPERPQGRPSPAS